jgi:photosystem II stability/assembly factor-like uncharacterized protein
MGWTNASSEKAWTAVAMSSDGTKRVAVADDIYISTDSGATWTAKSQNAYGPFNTVCMSANGSIILAQFTGYAGGFLKSTDGGSTWNEWMGGQGAPYVSVAMSDNGNYVLAVFGNNAIARLTTDGGNNWGPNGTSAIWSSVCMSANGLIQYKYSESGCYRSVDGGSTWSWFTSLGPVRPQGMSCSADGLRVVFARYGLGVSVNNNGTWNVVSTARNYVCADISDDGLKVMLGVDGGYTYASTDGGATVTQIAGSESLAWKDVAISSSGNIATFVANNQAIRLYEKNDAPTITSGASANFVENGAGVAYTITATDPELSTIVYSLEAGGTDNGLFNVNPSNGQVTFKTPPDFESPADSGANNVYDIKVGASDGVNVVTKDVAITVTDVVEGAVLPTEGAGAPILVGSVAVGTITEDPRTAGGVTYNGNPLPAGSVLRNTTDGQKFIAGGTSATDFAAIEITPPAAWGFSAGGGVAWATLQAR